MHETDGAAKTPQGTAARIRSLLQEALATEQVVIEDESALHAGHPGARGGGGHYRVYAVSDRFAGLSRLARHRLVYDSLHDLMQRDVHALSLSLVTPEEAERAGAERLPIHPR